MMLSKFFTYILLIISLNIYSKEADRPELNSKNIPIELLSNANAVIRNRITEVDIKSESEILISEYKTVTIINKEGIENSFLEVPYNTFSEIQNISGTVYNDKGEFVRKIKKEEIKDLYLSDNFSLYNDNRLKYLELYYGNFPFTVEYSYDRKINGYIRPPAWTGVSGDNISAENVSLNIKISNRSINLSYKDFSLDKCKINEQQKEKTYSWTLYNFKAVLNESSVPDSFKYLPTVFYKTDKFQIGKSEGSFSTWSIFGSFFYNLQSQSDDLNKDAVLEINKITGNTTDKMTKAKLLYKWLQLNYRYISVQEGIGGVQPFDANYVYKNKFGDCKALVNFMKSALKVSGIDSYPVLISAGQEQNFVYDDFPYDYFNHVILSVPISNDTIWLECTSQSEPFNYLGSFTSDRKGLLLNNNNCTLVSTPVFSSDKNRSIIVSEININDKQNSNCKIKYSCSGELQDDWRIYLYSASIKERDAWIKNELAFSEYKINSLNIPENNFDSAITDFEIALESPSITTISGNRIFIHPFVNKSIMEEIPVSTSRKFPLQIGPESQFIDSVIIHIPRNYHPESLDKIEKFTSDFGSFEYHMKYDSDSSTVYLFYNLKQRKIIVSPEKYKDCIEFRNKVINLINKAIVCKNS